MRRPKNEPPPRPWGRALDAEAAREYCGVDVERTPGAPAPIKLSPRRKVWLREQLDDWIDRAAGKNTCPEFDIWDQ